MKGLDNLVVSQNDVRHELPYLRKMVSYVEAGGVFDKESLDIHAEFHQDRPDPPLIGITRFPDGVLLLHDGHNRAVACYLGGRDYFKDSEYFIKDYTYEDYTALEPEYGWFTPFDPWTEVRRAEFSKYKNLAKRIYRSRPEALSDFVSKFRHHYCLPREIYTVEELAKRVERQLMVV